MRHVVLRITKMTIQEQIKELDTRIEMQSNLIYRYAKANKIAPDFYWDELYQLVDERNNLVKKAKLNIAHIMIIQC